MVCATGGEVNAGGCAVVGDGDGAGTGSDARSQPAKANAVSPSAVLVMNVLRDRRCAGVCCMEFLMVPDLCGLALNATGLGLQRANLLPMNSSCGVLLLSVLSALPNRHLKIP